MMIPLHNILFLDIETVSQYRSYQELPEAWKELWTRKAESLLRNSREEHTVESIYERAAIYAEFGKIICISCGILQGQGENKTLTVKSFSGHDEREILAGFSGMLERWTPGSSKFLCAHNGKEFDFPYLCRRLIVNELPIPALLNTSGKKPWELNFLDTMDLWKFGDYKSYISLNLLAHVLNVPTSKDDIDGSMVGNVYWNLNDLSRIVQYCQKDVITLTQIYLKMNREPLALQENIEIK
ncbi:MAG TPA: 3'-5' exonuclease [Flavitalea sp.]|nr:3'-5' exonuclease [Flavitalea sp.]